MCAREIVLKGSLARRYKHTHRTGVCVRCVFTLDCRIIFQEEVAAAVAESRMESD